MFEQLIIIPILIVLSTLKFLDYNYSSNTTYKFSRFGFLLLAIFFAVFVIIPLGGSIGRITDYLLVTNYNSAYNYSFGDKQLFQSSLPKRINNAAVPEISALAYIIVDKNTQTILSEKNSMQKLPPASTTKMMTALTAYDLYDLDSMLLVPATCTRGDNQKAGFQAGDYVSVRDLFFSLLVSSSGDAACALASGFVNTLGGEQLITYDKFIDLMNLKAASLNLDDTVFSNPIGLDDANGNHVSSAWDLYLLSVELTKNTLFKQIVQTKEYVLYLSNKKVIMTNTNKLLFDVEGTVGIKTGTTAGAGEVLVYEYNKDSTNIVIVVMGSSDRFTDTKNLLEWVISSYKF